MPVEGRSVDGTKKVGREDRRTGGQEDRMAGWLDGWMVGRLARDRTNQVTELDQSGLGNKRGGGDLTGLEERQTDRLGWKKSISEVRHDLLAARVIIHISRHAASSRRVARSPGVQEARQEARQDVVYVCRFILIGQVWVRRKGRRKRNRNLMMDAGCSKR